MGNRENWLDETLAFEELTARARVGYLGIITPDGYPRVVPMNFAADGETIYLHGATEGELFAVLSQQPKVTFSIDLDYAYIPSYWTSKMSAGAATMFYKSALIKGNATVVDDSAEKVHSLQLLMDKYQPEGKYVPLDAKDRVYKHLFKATAVYRIDPKSIDVKINFRQKKSDKYNRRLIEKLEKRGEAIDLATAAEIRRMLGDDDAT